MSATITAVPTSALPLEHPEFAALFDGIRANPTDEAFRGVAADWCDEHEFTRLATLLRATEAGIPCGRRKVRVKYHDNGKGWRAWSVVVINSIGRYDGSLSGAFSVETHDRLDRDALTEAFRYALGHFAAEDAKQDKKAEERKATAAAKKAWENPYKVGDLLHYSWGYDETHNEFAEVVAVGPRSVTIRQVVCESISQTSWCSEKVRPVKGRYLTGPKGEPTVARITFRTYGGKLHHSIPAGDGRHWYKVEDGRETFHESWGH